MVQRSFLQLLVEGVPYSCYEDVLQAALDAAGSPASIDAVKNEYQLALQVRDLLESRRARQDGQRHLRGPRDRGVAFLHLERDAHGRGDRRLDVDGNARFFVLWPDDPTRWHATTSEAQAGEPARGAASSCRATVRV